MTHVRIVIASVLKPLYEPRMYEKIGISLSEIPNTDVHVIGYGIENQSHDLLIQSHGLGNFARISLRRLLTPWRILAKVFKLRPSLLIACTHELLLPFVLYKLLFPRTTLVYDIQENYYLNILYTNAFPWFLKFPLALWVRSKERITLLFYSLVLSAEQCYLIEMPFIQAKAICIENKALSTHNVSRSPSTNQVVILYSGTISKEYGIYEAIDLVEKLHILDARVSLMIRGYCAHALEAKKLQTYIQHKKFIDANDFTKPIPYSEIVAAIANATCGLLSYRSNKSTQHRIPTKLYEYMAYRLPILSVENAKWSSIIEENKAGISIDFRAVDSKTILSLIKYSSFYNTPINSDTFLWKKEAHKLKSRFSIIIKEKLRLI